MNTNNIFQTEQTITPCGTGELYANNLPTAMIRPISEMSEEEKGVVMRWLLHEVIRVNGVDAGTRLIQTLSDDIQRYTVETRNSH